jgi:hypothetical protein
MTRLPWLALGVLLTGCPEHGSGGARPDGGGSLRPCGGFAGTSCTAAEWCDFGRNTCGAGDEQGTCRARPSGCDDLFAPVCGCNGLEHANECAAQAVGVDVNASGSCPVPADRFACGFRTCVTDVEYCQRGVSDVGNEPDSFLCKPLPGSCGSPATCGCVAAEPCGSICMTAGAGRLTVTCPGG